MQGIGSEEVVSFMVLLFLIFLIFFLVRSLYENRDEILSFLFDKSSDDQISKMSEWGYKKGSREDRILTKICKRFRKRLARMNDMGGKRALELRYPNPKGDGINISTLKILLAWDMVAIAKILNKNDPNMELKTVGENPFPAVFLFTHPCIFFTKYGKEIRDIDAVATISLDDLRKIQPEFQFNFKNLVHRVARLEISDTTPIDVGQLTFEEAIIPGIVKGKKRKRKDVAYEMKDLLLREADYSCQQCGARLEDGATLEIDHVIPVSKGGTDDYVNLQILCATCNRKRCQIIKRLSKIGKKYLLRE